MGKNILIFSDATGQAGGYMPDETRSNVYKLFRATRVCPDSSIDPALQLAFYDGGLGSRAQGGNIKIKWWRGVYNLVSRATGLGITQNIIDCYAQIIRVWQPGDRIYLFGFSRGAYTARCVGGVLKHCGVPTAERRGGRVVPLQRDLQSARRIAAEAVKRVYQYGSSIKGDPLRAEREKRAIRFRAKYCSGDAKVANTAPYFIGVWDTVETLGAGSSGVALVALVHAVLCAGLAGAAAWAFAVPFWTTLGALAIGAPVVIYAAACARYRGIVSLARYRRGFYDTQLNHAVRYARHALSIDENRLKFDCIPWDLETPGRIFTDQPQSPARLKQVWFAGSHSDIGGSYPETESRLSDVALAWMVDEAMSLPHPINIEPGLLQLYPDSAGPQHDERKALLLACPGWLLRCALLFVRRRDFGWREGHRHIPADAHLHPSVHERLALPAVLIHGRMAPYRPVALRRHGQARQFWPQRPPAAGQPAPLVHRLRSLPAFAASAPSELRNQEGH